MQVLISTLRKVQRAEEYSLRNGPFQVHEVHITVEK